MDFDRELVALYPYLYRYACSLCRDPDTARDLVQTTMMNAIAKVHQFTPGTNLQAWTTVILRNVFLTEKRTLARRQRHMIPLDGHDVSVDAKEQFNHLAFAQAIEWLNTLPVDQKVALQLVGLNGEAYDAVAQKTEVAVGTVKSRVSRARDRMRDHKPEDS